MNFAIFPTALDAATIHMTDTMATDISGPVEYYFLNTSNGAFRTWSTSLAWTNTGLTGGLTYGFQLKARDGLGNETAWSPVAHATAENDRVPPTPDPMSFAVVPTTLNSNTIIMTATTAADINGPVEYFFENTSNGQVQGWSTSATWTNAGLINGQTYGYHVKARDAWSNETAWSSVAIAAAEPLGIRIYEPFDYPPGGLNGASGSTEIGLDLFWSGGITPVATNSLTYGPLLNTTGGKLANFSGGQNKFGGARPIQPGALAVVGLLDDGATLWFSLLLGNDTGANLTNLRLGFALANNSFNAGNYNYWIDDEDTQRGSGIGVTLGRIDGVNGRVVATEFRNLTSGDGYAGNRLGSFTGSRYAVGEHGLIVGKIVWGATNDTIELYQPDTNLAPGAVISTLTTSVDQSTFDTITFARGDRVLLDEIRFGSTYAQVTPIAVPLLDLLMLTKTASESTWQRGTNLVYTITVTNRGALPLSGVVVTDSLPAMIVFDSSTPAANQTNGSDYVFDLGTLAGGAGTSIVIHTTLASSAPGTIINRAGVSITNQEDNIANNRDTAITVIPDTDGDGISNPFDPDDDNDRVRDDDELIAGTLPQDPTSFLWLRIAKTSDQTIRTLTFPTVLTRTYRIQSTTNFVTGPWMDVQTNIPGINAQINTLETSLLHRVYYRIGVHSP